MGKASLVILLSIVIDSSLSLMRAIPLPNQKDSAFHVK